MKKTLKVLIGMISLTHTKILLKRQGLSRIKSDANLQLYRKIDIQSQLNYNKATVKI